MDFNSSQNFQPTGRQQVQSNFIQQQPQSGGGFFGGLLEAVQGVAQVAAPIAGLTGNAPLAATLSSIGGASGAVNGLAGGGQPTQATQTTPVQSNQVTPRESTNLAETETDVTPTAPEAPPEVSPEANGTPTPGFSPMGDIQQYLMMQFMRNPLQFMACLLYTSPSPRDQRGSRMPSSA